MVGGSLLGQKKYAEAEPLLLSGYEGMAQRADKIPAAGKPHLKKTLQCLVQLYEATGRLDQAAKWKTEVTKWYRKEVEQYRMAADLGGVQALNNLAWLLVTQHKTKEAEPLAKKALKRAPDNYNVVDTYAELEHELGRCGSAMTYETRATDLARAAPPAVREHLATRLSELRAACHGNGP